MVYSQEIRIFGPPGTGKTTTLSGLIATAARDYGSEGVLVSSFTRAAARELVSRGLPISEDRIGTLHALCYRALERPKLVSHELLKDWNAEHPFQAFGGVASNLDDPYGDFEGSGAKEGDRLLQEYSRLRGLGIPEDGWPLSVQDFGHAWKDFKSHTFTMDFTDLIEQCVTERLPIPHQAAAFFLDEVQDFSPLELSLARWWGASCERVYLAGDDDQCLYSFKGATPDAFLSPALPAEQVRILGQSYRVPRAVHAAAVAWVEQLSVRMPKDYKPKQADGLVEQLPVSYTYLQPIQAQLNDWLDAGKTVAFLASCSFFIDPIKTQLREWGIPFHNPYRRSRGDWNPLMARAGTMSAAERVRAYRKVADEQNWWTYRDLWAWAGMLESEAVLTRGAKSAMRKKAEDEQTAGQPVEAHDLETWLPAESSAEAATTGNLGWLQEHLLKSHEKPVGYACRVIEHRGMTALKQDPQVIIGTIHCSPGDEPILTTEGWVEIGKLDPNKHRLASYAEGSNRLMWGGKNGTGRNRKGIGYPFAVARQTYQGDMITLATNLSKTRVTPSHVVRVRFTEAFFNKWIVYLMRRGDWWRIGMCTSGRRPYKSGGLKGRMATELADDGWILGVFDTARDAYKEELRIQCEYGVPGLTFQACKSRSFQSEELHIIHESLRGGVATRIPALLADFGLNAEWPLCKRSGARKNQRGMFLTHAANVLDRYMEMPVPGQDFIERSKRYNCRPSMLTIRKSVERAWSGDVYSLEVLPYHYYISGKAVVHNSVKGGEADVVVLFPDLSPAGYREWTTPGDAQDSVRRCFYVGMTRAKEALYWGQPTGMCIGGYL